MLIFDLLKRKEQALTGRWIPHDVEQKVEFREIVNKL